MSLLPILRRLADRDTLVHYAAAYEACSGLPIPTDYLHAPCNHVFGVFYRGELIGGFLLGNSPCYRTLTCFAQPELHADLLREVGGNDRHTEICCFFIEPAYRNRAWLNLTIWLYLTYAIRRYGRYELLFGTNSASLAKLYGQTHQSRPFHTDRVGGKRTFIFQASRARSVRGMLEIIWHKLGRQRKIRRSLAARKKAQILPRFFN